MLTGYNTDIKHEGTIYHVQTEDGGVDNPVIVSLVYQGGRILASRKTSYAQMVGQDGILTRLRDLLEKQHRAMIRAILTGTLGSVQGKGTMRQEPGTAATEKPPVIPAAPGQPRPPAEAGPIQPQASASEKNLDQVILEYLASEIDND